MNTTTALFYVFSAVLLAASFGVITARSTVHAALYLVLAFFSAACVWMLLKAEFLAIALVLVYVGAVMVLFLFVVMMLDVNFDGMRAQFRSYIPVGATVGALVLVEMALVLAGGYMKGAAPASPPDGGNTRALGMALYTQYGYAFEIASVVLLVAIVAAIALTHRKRKETRHQEPGEQVKVRAGDRLRVLSMPSEKKPER